MTLFGVGAVLYGILNYDTANKLEFVETMLLRTVEMVLSGLYEVHVIVYVTDARPLASAWGDGYTAAGLFASLLEIAMLASGDSSQEHAETDALSLQQRWNIEIVQFSPGLGTDFAWAARNDFLAHQYQPPSATPYDIFVFFEVGDGYHVCKVCVLAMP